MIKHLAILLSPDGASGGGAAPAAAPATAPAPAPTPKPAAASPAPAADAGGDSEPNPFDALDGMIAKSRGKEPPKPDDAKGDLRDKSKDLAPDPKDKGAAAPAVDPKAVAAQGPKALREQLEKTNGELKTFREKATALEAKIADYEKRGKDTATLADRLAVIEKEKESLAADLRALRQEASPEFKAKYEVPFQRAADVAKNLVTQLQTVEMEGADGSMVPPRAATWDDFARIYAMPYGQAAAEAEKLFGKSERVIMAHWERLHGLQEEKNLAMNDERANWKKKEEESKAAAAAREAQKEKTIAEVQSAWKQVNAEILEKNPELYGAKPDDKEEATILAKAYETWEAKPKTWKGQVIKDAMLRNRLAASYLQEHRMAKQADRIAELEAALAAAKGSRPGSTRTPGGTEKAGEASWSEDLKQALA